MTKRMLFDAHIHVGYFPRKDGKGGEAYYYSPARVMQYMRWAGVNEFIFSSTNACWDEHAETMHSEAAELVRLSRLQNFTAHPFFWVSSAYLAWDATLSRMPTFYEGLKLHGGEAHWTEHPQKLRRLLAIARERHLPVQIHTSNDDINGCEIYLPYCREFSSIRIDLAHGHPLVGAKRVLEECPNVWIDISFMETKEIEVLWKIAPDRLMYGSDFPAPLRYWNKSCTKYMLGKIREIRQIGGKALLHGNAQTFLNISAPN